jgi:molybdenum cofactor guanylyltransferase
VATDFGRLLSCSWAIAPNKEVWKASAGTHCRHGGCRRSAWYDREVETISAFILAGGQSSRMGSDKAFLNLAGSSLLARALEVAGSVAGQVRIVGSTAKFAPFGGVIEDVYPNCGPLGGIHAALTSTKTELNLILGVDLPYVETGFLNYLLREAQAAGAVATVPQASGHYHPLCAIYRKQFASAAEQALSMGHNKIDALFPRISLRVIEEEELVEAGFDAGVFRNLNTPEEWERAKQEFQQRQHL